jgi:hypothetical protein
MKCYMMTWVNIAIRQQILDYLDTLRSEVVNWRASSGAIFMISGLDALTLTEKIHAKFPGLVFIITPITIEEIQGYADSDTWNFIRFPRPIS